MKIHNLLLFKMGIAFAMMAGAINYIVSGKTELFIESIVLLIGGLFLYILCFTFYLIYKEEK